MIGNGMLAEQERNTLPQNFSLPSSPKKLAAAAKTESVAVPEEAEAAEDDILHYLRQILAAIKAGHSLVPYRDKLSELSSNFPDKASLVDILINHSNLEALCDLVAIRNSVVSRIRFMATRGELSPSEALVLWKMVNEQIPEVQKSLKVEAKEIDAASVISNISLQQIENEKRSAEYWQGTTPQGREIIRKHLLALKKQLKNPKAAEKVVDVGPAESEDDDFEAEAEDTESSVETPPENRAA
jgi:hypothetical protein